MRWKCTVEGDDRDRSNFFTLFLYLVVYFGTSKLNLLFSCEKEKNIPLRLILVNSDCCFDGCLDIVCFWLFAEVDINIVHSAWNVESG